jgi:hypothetical protein
MSTKDWDANAIASAAAGNIRLPPKAVKVPDALITMGIPKV